MRGLLATRRESIVPLLPGLEPGAAQASIQNRLLDAQWGLNEGRRLRLLANLGDRAAALPRIEPHAIIWGDPAVEPMPPWSVLAILENR